MVALTIFYDNRKPFLPDKPARRTLSRPRWLARLLGRVNRRLKRGYTRGEMWFSIILSWAPALWAIWGHR